MKEFPILYSTGCPRCSVLENKMKEKNIVHIVDNDVEEMKNLGIDQVPVLFVNGEYLDFKQAVEWANSQEE